MFLIIMPVIVPFLKSHELGMQAVFELQAIFAFSVVLLEVPSGYLADLFGRKNTLMLAGLFNGIGMTTLALGDSYIWFVVFEIIIAFAGSLFSGSDIAMIYDSLEGIESRDGEESQFLGRKIFYAQTGEMVAALLGGGFAYISLALPIQVNAVTGWIPLFIALTLTEPPRSKMSSTSHSGNIGYIWRSLFGHSKLLTFILLNLIFYGSSTLLAVWAFQGYWGSIDIPIYYFGYLWALFNGVVALTARLANRLDHLLGRKILLFSIALLPIAGYLGMAWGAGLFGIVAGLLFKVSRGLTGVLLRDDLNKRVTGDIRATANSVASLGVRLNFALLGPVLGALIDNQGYRVSFTIAAIFFVLVFFLIFLPLLRYRATKT
ncbi:MAG: MFS transporter [Calditrichia bacterium]